jgi:hypothetical protein
MHGRFQFIRCEFHTVKQHFNQGLESCLNLRLNVCRVVTVLVIFLGLRIEVLEITFIILIHPHIVA